MTTNKDWKQIEEEFIAQWANKYAIHEVRDVLDFFKPYFQEEMHELAKQELEIDCQWENCSGGQYCDKHSLESKPESSWEDTYAKDLGMCCAGCDCGHCGIRRDIVNKIEKEAYERGRSDILVDVEKYTYQGDDEATARCFYRIKQEIIKALKK